MKILDLNETFILIFESDFQHMIIEVVFGLKAILLKISTFLIKTTNIKKNKIINQNPHPRALQPIRLRLKPILLNH
ncbi:hypothetical protein BpHYR1_006099 [Brachionus plicatilis]|uniref:Uncharacterized protein n=1 Tax=Brachionus plicatilis TaxID=10195 RepID=A0A3M7SFS9_BRAPC|nr:hypothetical protein BpHYR1_006099 [Brachionus plicatilis]